MGDREAPTLRISGFGDINYSYTKKVEGPRGFSLGQFALHLASELSSRVTVFGELSFTARTDAGTDTPPAPGFNAEIERLIVRFDRHAVIYAYDVQEGSVVDHPLLAALWAFFFWWLPESD